jgi:catechol 2,3-dioxygenase-like lactoylglutathione lyase family enzyme
MDCRVKPGNDEWSIMRSGETTESVMPRVVGIDHLVLSVGDFARSKDFYAKLLGFLGFKLKHEYADMAGWSNGKTLLWIAAADAQGKKRKYRKGDIGFHHYAFELSSRNDVDALGDFLAEHGMNVVDPPGEYYGRSYYAVYFTDPDGMKLEGMVYKPPLKTRRPKKKKQARAPRAYFKFHDVKQPISFPRPHCCVRALPLCFTHPR